MIDGVAVTKLKVISDERGKVMRMLRSDDKLFRSFGEVYFSFVSPGIVKGWKKHLRMTQNFAVPVGTLKIVLFDDRPESRTNGEVQEVVIGQDEYSLLTVPPAVWYSFKPVTGLSAMIANCTDIPHDPSETVTKDLSDISIPYRWK